MLILKGNCITFLYGYRALHNETNLANTHSHNDIMINIRNRNHFSLLHNNIYSSTGKAVFLTRLFFCTKLSEIKCCVQKLSLNPLKTAM